MKLYIFKVFPDTLTDNEKVLAFLLSMMWKNVESDETVLTIHTKDLSNILFAASRGGTVKTEKLNNEGGLKDVLSFAVLGERTAIRIKDSVLKGRYEGRRLGTHRIEIKCRKAKNVAIYLHAVLNLMEDLFTSEDFNIFHGDANRKTRFAPEGEDFYKKHEIFRAQNIFQSE